MIIAGVSTLVMCIVIRIIITTSLQEETPEIIDTTKFRTISNKQISVQIR